MEIYLVGGAVRDRLLGRRVHERDWVVVGATPEDMRARGFRMVGRGFPVFLHPETAEEYALARTERKEGSGHRGFAVSSDPDVRLEDDLRRRDLTINAMAEDANGLLVDPYGGRADLDARILRHVSEAFAEDPLRVLRVARFRAELAPWDFRIAPETETLLRAMNASGELGTLTPERVGRETLRALASPRPSLYFTTLAEIGALGRVFPELAALVGVAQDPRLHGGLDAWAHTLRAVDATAAACLPPRLVYALLVHDLGKGVPGGDPRAHDRGGAEPVLRLTARLALGNEFRDLGLLAALAHLDVHRILALPSRLLLARLEETGLLRRGSRAAELAAVARIDWQARPGWEERPYPQGPFLKTLAEELATLRLPEALHEASPEAIRSWFARERRRRILLLRRRVPLQERRAARAVRDLYPEPAPSGGTT